MQAEPSNDAGHLVSQLVAQVSGASGAETRETFVRDFEQLRRRLTMYPRATCAPSAAFESVAPTARLLGTRCLPLGIAVVMHLYPVCALQSVPLPIVSTAQFKRMMLLRHIRNRGLVLANAGSERTRDADSPLTATLDAEGVRIEGTCEYMSLASVADIVFLKASLPDGRWALCAADLGADTLQVGEWKFKGRMRLSDTTSIRFVDHRVPHGRYAIVQNDIGLGRIADYQRCWFHLLLSELYLARIEHLQREWHLDQSAGEVFGRQDVASLREDSLRLLDRLPSTDQVGPLMRITSLLKLRVSIVAQQTAAALRRRAATRPAEAATLEEDASELCFMRLQPTSDERILRSLEPVGERRLTGTAGSAYPRS
jgi:hypothetical protein